MIGLEFSLVFLGFCLLFDVWRGWRDSGAIRFQLVSGLSPLAHKNEHAFMRQPPIPKKGALCSFYGTVGRLKTGSAGRLALPGGRGADGDGTPRGQLPRNLGHAVPLWRHQDRRVKQKRNHTDIDDAMFVLLRKLES